VIESGLQAQIESARAYDALFVPALFGQWAPKLDRAAQLEPGQRVLDVACGTGDLARLVDAETGPTGYVAGLDAHLGMLAVARELAPTVDWRHGAASIDITTERGTARFPSVRVMVEADLRGWLPVMGVTLGEQEIGYIVREAERVLGSYVTADGTVEFNCAAHLVIATA
jgi:SAM-dependent methyltransferase